MKKMWFFILILLGFSFNSVAKDAVPGEFIVKLKKTAKKTTWGNLSTQSNSKLGVVTKIVSKKSNAVVVKRPAVETYEYALQQIKNNPNVEMVVPNYYRYLDYTANDQMYSSLWGLKNSEFPGIDINAEGAWDLLLGHPGVVVAVIDTGVDYNHPDLARNIWINHKELNGQPGVDDDGNGYIDDVRGYDFANNDNDPLDTWGHGTHCAGTIGAVGNDGVGVVGVSMFVRIMPVQIFTPEKGAASDADIIRAIDYAVDNGAHILSNSWGGTAYNPLLEEAFKRARDANVVVIAAAGNGDFLGRPVNNDTKPHYPANLPFDNIISVAALQKDGTIASFSNYGVATVDVAAPGVDILSIMPGGQYALMSGTSMAAPHVSGLAALIKGANPYLSAKHIAERIIYTSKPLPSLQGKILSGGLINARNAVMGVGYRR